jgi:hypothetical protein
MSREYLTARVDPLPRDHQHEHPSWLQPSKAVLQEQALRSLVVSLGAFKVVGRIQEYKAVAFNRAVHIETIPLHYVIQRRLSMAAKN